MLTVNTSIYLLISACRSNSNDGCLLLLFVLTCFNLIGIARVLVRTTATPASMRPALLMMVDGEEREGAGRR